MSPEQKRIKGSAGERARARLRLRNELLAAARGIAEETGGYDRVTIRSVADRVGYAPPIVYEYFANKDDLLYGVVETGFAELAEFLGDAQCPGHRDGAIGVLPAVAEAYWAFATNHPRLYRLMSSQADIPFGTAETPAPARRCFQLLKDAVIADAPRHPATSYDADAATDLFWAQLHGLVTLALDGRIKGGASRAHDLVEFLVTGFLRAEGGAPPPGTATAPVTGVRAVEPE